jgi:hypothetical protein
MSCDDVFDLSGHHARARVPVHIDDLVEATAALPDHVFAVHITRATYDAGEWCLILDALPDSVHVLNVNHSPLSDAAAAAIVERGLWPNKHLYRVYANGALSQEAKALAPYNMWR